MSYHNMFSLFNLRKNTAYSQENSSHEPVLHLLSRIEKKYDDATARFNTNDKKSVLEFQKGVLHTEVEKYLNSVYPLDIMQQSQKYYISAKMTLLG
jgi:type I site-specific restriction endonuclease